MATISKRWIAIELEKIPILQWLNFKDKNGCVIVIIFSNQHEISDFLETSPSTHWRPIERV